MKRIFFETDDGSVSLRIPELDETYHSKYGAIVESAHVFIDSGLKQLEVNPVRIFEMGFGTGLNAYLSYIYLSDHKIDCEYFAVEKYPLSIKETDKLNFPDQLYKPRNTFEKLHSSDWDTSCIIEPGFSLKKILGDVKTIIMPENCHLVYYDAFAPEIQPYLWEIEVLEKMYNSLNTEGILVTYCAKGQVRRNLVSLGFEVERLKGPPGKREILRAIKK